MALDVPAGTPDRGPGLVALCIFLMVLVILAIVGRIASKFIVRQYWWWDDLFALLSLPVQLALLTLILVWRNYGLGLHAEVVAAHNPLFLITGGKILYVAIFFFDTSISFPKLSAIFFYTRVFSSNNTRFRINLWVVGSIVSGWIFSAIISTIFQCTPIPRAWNPTLPGTCINTYPWYLATASISVVVDFYILLLPVPEIWALKTSLRRRVYLLAAFFLAYSVIVISIGRLISTVNIIPTASEDLTWNFPRYLYWACLEGSISLVSVCVPNLIGLVKALMYSRKTLNSTSGGDNLNKGTGSRIQSGLQRSLSTKAADRDGFERLVSTDDTFSFKTSGPPRRSALMDQNRAAIPLDKIHVQTQISISRGDSRHGRVL
ncbi:hypothetical protein F4861DRAFT_537481 [Xylaria intraflava]|nr:hypothetical protein F4861DRAFT_537481 [Xylaria intraflava]